MEGAHINLKKEIQLAFDDQTDSQYGEDPDKLEIDFSDVKISHNGYKNGDWTVEINETVTKPSPDGKTEVYFRAKTDVTQSFRLGTDHAYMEAKVAIPEEYRLPMREVGGKLTGYPTEIVVPYIGEGDFNKSSRCLNSRTDGSTINFEELTIQGEIVIYTHFSGMVKITRGGEDPEPIKMEEVLDDLKLLEVNPQNPNSKFFASRGTININLKREVLCKP